MTIVLYDTVTVSTVPSFANTSNDAVAGYIDGLYNDQRELVAAFPLAKHMSIAVTARDDADCLDVEPRDATNADVVGWYQRQKARGAKLIVFYTSASNTSSLTGALAAGGIKRGDYKVWSAHYTFRSHICAPGVCGYPQADGTQWTDRSLGRNLDESLLQDDFFSALGPPPPPPDPNHYLWYDATKRLLFTLRYSERESVLEYDKLRATQTPTKHPDRYRLFILRGKCFVLANRIWAVAHTPGRGGFAADHRGFRFQQLRHRFKGQRVV